jgi:3-hydroxyisobutyrate dehydrogenase-like beta-hydroxyacid dehydrogenase
MTDLMAKDLDLAIGYAASARTPLFTAGMARQILGAASNAGYGREDFSAIAKVLRTLGES